jgi:hypothetical protein
MQVAIFRQVINISRLVKNVAVEIICLEARNLNKNTTNCVGSVVALKAWSRWS